ncbi:LexA family transcriptional regulator [Microbulbifer sp. OS29]|uniref:LexA family transcriptional regulator n=1 Tax=Microbulbifer okhotskensis TaxID=2926617 RepID=A0A9X2ERY7_9GAMM|nr:S24 family peptidase [Microbulbifer okhotskensis]MCO1336714.1 LexA family transcriptional regulator [Microbulbifer okhotskensis]
MLEGEKLGRAIEEARKIKGVTKAELARQFGVSSQSVQGWVKTGRIKKTALLRLIAYFQGDVGPEHWELTSYPATSPRSQADINEGPRHYDSNVREGPPIRGKVPLISTVQAGKWMEVIDNLQPGDAEEWRETTANVGPNAFALRVEGDSMTTLMGVSIPHGSVVIVDPDAEYINGSIVVAKLTDIQEATLKKLVIDGPNKYLKPLNPAYSPIVINGNCQIVGVAKKVEYDL